MTWMSSPGTYLSGQEAIDSVDLIAIAMERKWGADRLRCLVSEDLRTKFDSQRLKTNKAIWHGELDDVIRETRRMQSAWRTLDKAATDIGAKGLAATVWEVSLPDGLVIQIVRESDQANLQAASEAAAGRKVAVYTLEEVGRILAKFPTLYQTKSTFPGAEVTQVRMSVRDPLEGMDQ